MNGIAEASWCKLPNDDILVVDSDNNVNGATSSEAYSQALGQWIALSNVPVSLSGSIAHRGGRRRNGPRSAHVQWKRHLLRRGRAHRHLRLQIRRMVARPRYSQRRRRRCPGRGSWSTEKILLTTQAVVDGTNGNWQGPIYFYQYDPATGSRGTFTPISAPNTNAASGNVYSSRMLALPDGNILFTYNSHALYVYEPDSPPQPAGQPQIYGVSWNPDGSLHVTGTLFNGISQGAAYGDDQQMDSNYPLARFTDSSDNVYYGRTYNWSSVSVQTGSKVVSTEVQIPAALFDSPGSFTLQIVANGNASPGFSMNGPVWVDFNYSGLFQFGDYPFPYETLAQGVKPP